MSGINVSKVRVKVNRRKHPKHPSQSENIHGWKPWEAALGPKTDSGKAKVTRNLPLKPCSEWRLVCKVLKLPMWRTFHIDVTIDASIARKLSPNGKWVDIAPVRFRARLSKDRQRILFWSVDQTYTTDASGQPVEDSKVLLRRLNSEMAAIEKDLKRRYS